MSTTTTTLRLPLELKARLDRTVDSEGSTLNQVVIDILNKHYEKCGFHASNSIKLENGRTLNIKIKEVDQHPPGLPACWFILEDEDEKKEIACYQIGASQQLLRRFYVKPSDEYLVVADLGKSLLHHHNKRGADIARLQWRQLANRPDLRILDTNDLKTMDQDFIMSLEHFHLNLGTEGSWQDRHLKPLLKPILSKTMSLTLQMEAQKHFDQHIESLKDPLAAEQLTTERNRVMELLAALVAEGSSEEIGAGDPSLNDKEVHFFSARWKANHPPLEQNRVIVEFGKGSAQRAISTFAYELSQFFLDEGQPYFCRWIENGIEQERQLIAS